MIRLEDTTGNAVVAAIAAERHKMGSPATGMVLTLLVVADEDCQSDATQAAVAAAREHPMRILVMIPRPSRAAPQLDAEINVGGDEGPGEVAVLRLRGQLAAHAGSVAIPLLLSDTPVVAWWPVKPPPVPAEDPLGRHAQRRITDSATARRPYAELSQRQDSYAPGDTDLAWTRLTPWRTMLAAALDQPFDPIIEAEVSVQRSNPSGPLLAGWLRSCLGVPVSIRLTRGPGITAVRMVTARGDISLTRPDGRVAKLTRPLQPMSTVALPRRGLDDLLTEELRRLDPDDVYGEVLEATDLAPESRKAAKGTSTSRAKPKATKQAKQDKQDKQDKQSATPDQGAGKPAARTARSTGAQAGGRR